MIQRSSLPILPPTTTSPAAKPPVLAPTMGECEISAAKLAELLGQDQDFVSKVIGFSIKSAATARALVEYCIFMVRCQVAEAKVSARQGDRKANETADGIIKGHLAELKAARTADLANEDTTRTLKGLPVGSKLQMVPAERRVLVDHLAPMFNPPAETPMAEAAYREIVGFGGWHLRFGDWLIRLFLDEGETSGYEESLKAARATAEANTETDTDTDANKGTETEAAAG